MGGVTGLTIKEKVRTLEAVSAILGAEIEMANKYQIFNQDGSEQLFYAVEQTDFCTRQLKQCCGDCAAWNVDILYTQGGRSDQAFKLHRDFTMTCCCLNRPAVDVNTAQGQKIGTLRNPCTACDLVFDIEDATGTPLLKINGSCCQMGLFCPCPCGPCSTVHFEIKTPDGNNVGTVKKRIPGMCKWLIADDADNYHVDFPGVNDPAQKILLMGASIFMDFRYFNNNSADQGGGGGDAVQGLLGGD